MAGFHPDIQFSLNWRSYQARVLEELNEHLDDNHLHIVAAPGSGKTVLGLEVVRRLNTPTLILAPTVAIRDQWIDRFVQLFCPAHLRKPDWISRNIARPGFLTVSTYQGLYSACTGGREEEEKAEDTDLEETPAAGKTGHRGSHAAARKLTTALKQAQVRTIVVDEAHHLRSEWWKCLMDVKTVLANPTVIALTATPPYDVNAAEWQRYNELCGPVDAEISVPELVWKGDLCPHQDCLYLSTPTDDEHARMRDFRHRVAGLCRYLLAHDEFQDAIASHPAVVAPTTRLESLFDDPPYHYALAIFLKRTGRIVPKEFLRVLGMRSRQLPRFTLEWLEILLSGCLFTHTADFAAHGELFERIRRDVRHIGALEGKSVALRTTRTAVRLLCSSLSKLDSIEQIVRLESGTLAEGLRMVILTDFIRLADLPAHPGDEPPIRRIGVIPIFERIRRAGLPAVKLGILSGGIVVVPTASLGVLADLAGGMDIPAEALRTTNCRHDDRYSTVELAGPHADQLVTLVTRLFNQGGITVLVGTKSLLGEGWDAPAVNSLVLASFVGSYMLSNQMRGRAIRTQRGNPDKTANIWHPVCIETHMPDPGQDMAMLARRFKAFEGVSVDEPGITSGIERLGLELGPLSREQLRHINEQMAARALDRAVLRRRWHEAFAVAEQGRLAEEVLALDVGVPRDFVLRNTIKAVLLQGAAVAATVWTHLMQAAAPDRGPGGRYAFLILGVIAILSLFAALPFFIKALYVWVRFGPVAGSMRQIARSLLTAMVRTGLVKSDPRGMRLHVSHTKRGHVRCSLEGAARYETSLFTDALTELLGPIENPRYILRRVGRPAFLRRRDHHAVPSVLGRKKELAEVFLAMWKRHVGPADLIYTRGEDGRAQLLAARAAAMSTAMQERCDRAKTWM